MFNILLMLILAAAGIFGLDLWSSGQFPYQWQIRDVMTNQQDLAIFGGSLVIYLLLWTAFKRA